jgi:hypothetical protein
MYHLFQHYLNYHSNQMYLLNPNYLMCHLSLRNLNYQPFHLYQHYH